MTDRIFGVIELVPFFGGVMSTAAAPPIDPDTDPDTDPDHAADRASSNAAADDDANPKP